jgi:hypothetical protein
MPLPGAEITPGGVASNPQPNNWKTTAVTTRTTISKPLRLHFQPDVEPADRVVFCKVTIEIFGQDRSIYFAGARVATGTGLGSSLSNYRTCLANRRRVFPQGPLDGFFQFVPNDWLTHVEITSGFQRKRSIVFGSVRG